MTQFDYTDAREVHSTAVDEVHYNANTKELAVDLDDSIYIYKNVPEDVYRSLVFADSVGRKFIDVKRQYGPSSFLGYYDNVEYVKVGFNAPSMAAVGTPKNLTYAEGALVSTPSTTAPSEFRLTLGVNADSRNTAPTNVVGEELPETVKYNYVVDFVVKGGTEVRQFKTTAGNQWNDAVENLREVADMLGVDFDVKGVTVTFE